MTRFLSNHPILAVAPLAIAATLALCLPACSAGRSAKPAPGVDADELLRFQPLADGSVVVLPEWRRFQFEKIDRHTEYAVVVADDGRPALEARSRDAASALRRAVSIDPVELPWVSWTWRVDRSVPGADITRKDADDCAARVMLLYRYEPSRANFIDRARFESARGIHGEYPPWAMLVYAWTEDERDEPFIESPYSDRVRVVPVRTGDAGSGRWQIECRNHLEDYRRAFGEEPPPIEAIAIMVDTDNTGASVTARFGSLRFAGEEPDGGSPGGGPGVGRR